MEATSELVDSAADIAKNAENASALANTISDITKVGDDIIDAPVMSRVGIAIAVADAVPALDEFAHWRLKTPGGHGVFVEILERLFRESGIWDEVLERYRK